MHKYSPFSIYKYLILIVLSHSTCVVADSGVSNETGNKQNRLASSLYYIEARDEACTIREMKLRNGEERVLYTPKKCPDKFMVFSNNHILLVFKNYIQEIQLQPRLVEGPEISFPVPKVKPKAGKAKFSDAGYSANGELAIVMESMYDWDDVDAFLYIYRSGKWVLAREKYCHRFDWCGYKEIHQKPGNAYFWDEELNPWHNKQQDNPYIVDIKSTSMEDRDYIVTTSELTFRFDNSKSVLSITTLPGPDTGATLTIGIELQTQASGKKILSPNQCSASLMGKYLIVYVYWGDGTIHLYDLETGDIVKYIDKYQWIYE